MAATLATCIEEEQCSVICFLSSVGVKPIEIRWRMKVQYGDACLSLQQVYKWTRKFMNGISSVTDSPWPGKAHRVVTLEATAAVEAIVKENHRVTVNETAAHLDMSHGSAHHIIHIKKLKKKFKVFIWLTLIYFTPVFHMAKNYMELENVHVITTMTDNKGVSWLQNSTLHSELST